MDFVENVARYSGGGLSMQSVAKARIECAVFRQNVAYYGGGLKITDCQNVTLGDNHSCETSFEGNVAVEGGAVHLEPRDSENSNYKVRSNIRSLKQLLI